MSLDLNALLQLSAESTISWTGRDTALYALGVGLGRDPLDVEALRYVAIEPLRTLPSMAASLLLGCGISAKQIGVRFRAVVHAEQRVIVPRPLPCEATARVRSRIVQAYDRGPDKGAIIVSESSVVDIGTNVEIARTESQILARADGGFGGPPPPRSDWERPARPADAIVEFDVRPDQAILFRLSGDTNPLHVHPEVALAAGFKAPILQGLCTYGMACRAVQLVTGRPDAGLDLSARFSAPVYPGERLSFELWQDDREILFEGKAPAREVAVIKSGRASTL